jgi:hypothetical protein
MSARKKTLCFMHIGKTGGHSICMELFNRFDASKINNGIPKPFYFNKPDLIVGHWSFKYAKNLPHNRFLFSMVRDPIERVISNYYFMRSHPKEVAKTHQGVALAQKYDFHDFLEIDNIAVKRVVENHQTNFFDEDWQRSDDRSTPVRLERAITHLNEFDLIGLFEHYNESLERLCNAFGMKPWPESAKHNITKNKKSKSDLPKSTIQRIQDLNALDIELYDIIKTRFESETPKTYTTSSSSTVESTSSLPNKIKWTAAQKIEGDGWYFREQNKTNKTHFIWMGPAPEASLDFLINRNNDLQIKAKISKWVNEEIVNNIDLFVSNKKCDLLTEKVTMAPSLTHEKIWRIPKSCKANSSLRLIFKVPATEKLGDKEIDHKYDRIASFALQSLQISPYKKDISKALPTGSKKKKAKILLQKLYNKIKFRFLPLSILGKFSYQNHPSSLLLMQGIKAISNTKSRTSRIVEAEKFFSKAIKMDPRDPNSFYWKGVSLTYQGRLESALPAFEKAYALLFNEKQSRPLDSSLLASLYSNLGRTMIRCDRSEEAEWHLKTAILIDPTLKDDQHSLAGTNHLLNSIQENKKSRDKRKMSRWPVNLTEFTDLDHIIESAVTKGIQNTPLLSSQAKVVTLGSCFAQNVANVLKGYGVSANTLGIGELINSTFANRALLEWAIGEENPSHEPSVINVLKSFVGKSPDKFITMIKQADILIFTLGVAPAFFDKETGLFHLASPNEGAAHLLKTKEFRTTTVDENVQNLDYIVSALRKLNPELKIIFTVSPVPLFASFEYESAIQADCISKSTLRLAIDTLIKKSASDIIYWPAFEVVRWLGAYIPNMYGQEDGTSRHVSEHAISAIIKAFIKKFGDENLQMKLCEKEDKKVA